jgi:hypothetical protein
MFSYLPSKQTGFNVSKFNKLNNKIIQTSYKHLHTFWNIIDRRLTVIRKVFEFGNRYTKIQPKRQEDRREKDRQTDRQTENENCFDSNCLLWSCPSARK